MSLEALLNDLGRLPGITATADDAALSAMTTDFGRIERRRPRVIARPTDAAGVAALLGYAARQGLTVTARGAGHSQGGQCLTGGGIVLDTRGLRHFEPARIGSIRVGAGIEWREVVAASLSSGQLPPVLVDNLVVTVAGTLSVAGVGSASWRWGTQADHCLALEVVTGEGEVVHCSPEHEAELFRYVLCGLGQFGVVTRAECRLKICQPHTCTFRLEYTDLARCLADLHRLDSEERADRLEAWIEPSPPAGRGAARGFRCLILITSEVSGPGRCGALAQGLLEGLDFDRVLNGFGAPIGRYVRSRPPALEEHRRAWDSDGARPWVELFLPWTALAERLSELLPHLGLVDPVLLWPIRRQEPALPLLRLPAQRSVFVGSFSNVPPERLPETLPACRAASDLGLALGGSRYTSGWLGFDAAGWRRHFGGVWDEVRRLKRKYDPRGVLNPDLFGPDVL